MGKYPTLRGAASTAKAIGWIAVIFAGILLLVAVYNFFQLSSDFNLIAALSGAVGSATTGLILILVSEAVSVFIDIEHNTSLIAVSLTLSHDRINSPIGDVISPPTTEVGAEQEAQHESVPGFTFKVGDNVFFADGGVEREGSIISISGEDVCLQVKAQNWRDMLRANNLRWVRLSEVHLTRMTHQ